MSRPTPKPMRVLAVLALAGLAACDRAPPPDEAPPPSAVAVGTVAADPTVTDRRGSPRFLSELGPAPATVVVFTSAGCPLAARYLPVLADLERAYRESGVVFVAVDVGPATLLEACDLAFEHGAEFHVVKDFDGSAAAALGATRSPQVVVLDAARTIRYRGRVDGKYRLAGARPGDVRADLRLALDEVLAGSAVSVPETAVDGCPLEPETIAADPNLTWTRDVAPIVAEHCAPCHAEGGAGPFRLDGYDAVLRRREVVAEVVFERRMPPWFAHPHYGRFENDLSLDAIERRTLLAWLAAGAPRGDGTPDPEPQPRPAWRIGEPDLVLAAPPYGVPASGDVPYVHVLLDHVFEHDTWVEAFEVRPSRRSVVHHAQVMYVDVTREYATPEEWIPWGRLAAIAVPGREQFELPPGTAFLVPAGSALALQMHYVPDGRAGADEAEIGLRFPRVPVQKRLRSLWFTDFEFEIPPGATAYEARARRAPLEEVTMVAHSMLPHMHLRGRDAALTAHYPDGRTETLLRVPSYSFDWQLDYRWPANSKRFPPGTEFEFVARYDNSAFNALNPDPTIPVRFGELTTDEMMYCWLFYTAAEERLEMPVDPKTGRGLAPTPKRAVRRGPRTSRTASD